jgi:hypothetical protein
MVCQLARRITKRLNDQGYRKSAVPNPSWDDSSPPATQSDPLSSSRRDTSLRPEPDVDETSSKLADVNTKLASLEAWLREQLPRQEAERNEKRTSISGDEELLSQLRKLFSIPGSLDATKEPFSQVPHAPGDRDLLSQLRKLLSIGTSSNLFAHTLGQAPVRSADQDLHALLRRLLDPDRVATASDGPGFALRAAPEEKQAPIRFQDAIGRKFNFPFHLCKNWKVSIPYSRWSFANKISRAWRSLFGKLSSMSKRLGPMCAKAIMTLWGLMPVSSFRPHGI